MSRYDKDQYNTTEIKAKQAEDNQRKLMVIGIPLLLILLIASLHQCNEKTHIEGQLEQLDKDYDRLTKANKNYKQQIDDVRIAYTNLGKTYKEAFTKFGELTNAQQTEIDNLLNNLINAPSNYSAEEAEASIEKLDEYIRQIRNKIASASQKKTLNNYELRLETQRQTILGLRSQIKFYERALLAARDKIDSLETIIRGGTYTASNGGNTPTLQDNDPNIQRELDSLNSISSGLQDVIDEIKSNPINQIQPYFVFEKGNDREDVILGNYSLAKKHHKYFFGPKTPSIIVKYRINPLLYADSIPLLATSFIVDEYGNQIYEESLQIYDSNFDSYFVPNRNNKFEEKKNYTISIRTDEGDQELIKYEFTLKK